MVPIVFLMMMSAHPSMAGRNANGALIVHTNDAVTYTGTADYCDTSFLPASCGAAVTRTDKDENTPAVIWLLAAFPDTSSPAVTTIQFGIEHNLPANEGYFEAHGKCGELEMPDAGWPETGFGNLLSFGSTAKTDLLFPFYWFAAYGFEGAYFGTRTYPSTGEAKFADSSNPPFEDQISLFGTARWGLAGENECPTGGEDSAPNEVDHSESAEDIALGACCIPENGCTVVTADSCISQHGDFQGNGTLCDENFECNVDSQDPVTPPMWPRVESDRDAYGRETTYTMRGTVLDDLTGTSLDLAEVIVYGTPGYSETLYAGGPAEKHALARQYVIQGRFYIQGLHVHPGVDQVVVAVVARGYRTQSMAFDPSGWSLESPAVIRMVPDSLPGE